MKNKNYRIVITILLMVFMATAIALTNGCKKSEPAASEEDHTGHAHAMEKAADTDMTDQEDEEGQALMAKLRASADAEAEAVVEQTICPVMAGKPINKNVFVEYKGKKVYFCCPGCDGKFKANPEKYLSKLPQFQE